MEAALKTGTQIKYNILTKDQLNARGYKNAGEVIQAAAETKKVKLDRKIINKTSSDSN